MAKEKGKIVEILYTDLFKEQLTNILLSYSKNDLKATQKFKSYLDTIIINIPTKADKYKESAHFSDENIKEFTHEKYIIFFYHKKMTGEFLILAIIESI